MSVPNRIIDERFLEFRKRSTSTAGIACSVFALGLFEYRYFVDHRWSWDLLAVGATFVVVKLALMIWYYLTS
jgi:hypothetical protein